MESCSFDWGSGRFKLFEVETLGRFHLSVAQRFENRGIDLAQHLVVQIPHLAKDCAERRRWRQVLDLLKNRLIGVIGFDLAGSGSGVLGVQDHGLRCVSLRQKKAQRSNRELLYVLRANERRGIIPKTAASNDRHRRPHEDQGKQRRVHPGR